MNELEAVKSENERLKAELAAIRDAGGQEIDDLLVDLLHVLPNGYPAGINRDRIERLADIAKARGLRVAELRGEMKALVGEAEDRVNARSNKITELESEIKRLKSLFDNDTKVIARLTKEKSRIVGLFRFWVSNYSIRTPTEVLARGEEIRIEDVREIIEWIED